MVASENALRTVLLSLAINTLLALAKVVAGLRGHAQALVADGIESTADVISSLIVLGGIHLAARPADSDHPYGHGKYDSLASIAVAGMLVAAAAWISIESVHQILTPHQTPAVFTVLVLVGVILVKAATYRRVKLAGETVISTSLHGEALHQHADALTSIAALIGILIAIIGGRGYESADDWAALFACIVIVYNAVRLLKSAIDEILDASARKDVVSEVRRVASETEGVRGIGKCRVRKSGLGLLVDIHIKVLGSLTVREGHNLAHDVESRLRQSSLQIQDVTVHVEPAAESAVGQS